MSKHYYAEINLHIVFHTKHNQPLLTPEVVAVVHLYIRGRLMNTPGVYVHEVGGVEDHVHVAVSIAPTVVISELIGQMKGSAAHEANQKLGKGRKVLEWQGGYGVVSFGTNNLEWVSRYIQNQREHHAKNTIQERLERIETPEPEEEESAEEEAQAEA